jgi:hypothetical protein
MQLLPVNTRLTGSRFTLRQDKRPHVGETVIPSPSMRTHQAQRGQELAAALAELADYADGVR